MSLSLEWPCVRFIGDAAREDVSSQRCLYGGATLMREDPVAGELCGVVL